MKTGVIIMIEHKKGYVLGDWEYGITIEDGVFYCEWSRLMNSLPSKEHIDFSKYPLYGVSMNDRGVTPSDDYYDVVKKFPIKGNK